MAASVLSAGRTLVASGLAVKSTAAVVPRSCCCGTYGSASALAFGKEPRLRSPATLVGARRPAQRQYATALKAFSTATVGASATIKVGEKLPEGELSYLDKDSNVQTIKVSTLTEGKKVVLFAVPGAFTPTCTQKHVPQFVAKAAELKSKGVDTIACVSVNDVFVLNAWGESIGVGDKVMLLSDNVANFTKALGVQMDLSDKQVGLGIRSRRYALLADNGVVKQLNLEEGGAFTVSGPDEILKDL